MHAAQADIADAKQTASARAVELAASNAALEDLRSVHSKLVSEAQATNAELKKLREDGKIAAGEHEKAQARVVQLGVQLAEACGQRSVVGLIALGVLSAAHSKVLIRPSLFSVQI